MEPRPFGSTGLRVGPLGLGAGPLGDPALDEAEVGRVLGAAVDRGVRLIDTAPSYARSEDRIARHLGHRRDEVVLSTKGGYGVEGVPDWTPTAVERSAIDALRRLRTDRIDVFHLHSCPLEILARGEILEAVDAIRRAGHVRAVAYSGENEALRFAIECGRFDAVQASVSPMDQGAARGILREAAARGLGVIGKRPLANGCWRFAERPAGDYAETYWARLSAMAIDPAPLSFAALCLRYAAFSPGVSAVIAGTRSLAHLESNLAAIALGPLPEATIATLHAAWDAASRGEWGGEV